LYDTSVHGQTNSGKQSVKKILKQLLQYIYIVCNFVRGFRRM